MLTGGLNWGAQAQLAKFTPGIKFSLDLPGFAFANLDFNYLVDFSGGLDRGGAPQHGRHLERGTSTGPTPSRSGRAPSRWRGTASGRVLPGPKPARTSRTKSSSSPRSATTSGRPWGGAGNRVLVGTELQVWVNKFGVDGANEFLPQLLFVFGF